MRVEGALCGLGAALDGNGHRKAAGVGSIFSFPFQCLGDHPARHMVDGGFAYRLVKAGLRHPAHPLAAKDAHAGGIRFQHHRCDHRQARGHIHIVAAVLADGTCGTRIRSAAPEGSHLHHDALGRAQGHRFRFAAGQQQTRRPGSPQRGTGAGGVAAAQQLLAAADVMLKLRLSGRCLFGFRLRCAEQSRVLLFGQAVQSTDVLRLKRLFRGQHAGNTAGRNAHHRVRYFFGQLQLVQAQDHRQLLGVCKLSEDGEQFNFALDIQKRGRFVQQDHFRLLAQGPGQQDALALAVADAVKIPVCQLRRAHQLQGPVHLLPVLGRQNAQPSGVGIAPRRNKVEAGGQLHPAAVRGHEGQLLRPLGTGVIGKASAFQQHRAVHGGQLARQCAQQGGFACAVGADEGQDLARLHPEGNIREQRCLAVADGKTLCSAQKMFLHRAPS